MTRDDGTPDVTGWLARCPLVAILRGVRPDEVEAIGEALADAGVAILEVPLNSPEPIESVRRLAAASATGPSSAPGRSGARPRWRRWPRRAAACW